MSSFFASSSKTTEIKSELDKYSFEASDLSLDEKEIKNLIDDMTSTVNTRSPEEIDEQNKKIFREALHSAVFASITKVDKPVLPKTEVADRDLLKSGLSKEDFKKMFQKTLGFSFLHGNITKKKYWMKLKDDGEKSVFFSLPDLDKTGHRSIMVHNFRHYIQAFLKAGHKNTLTTVLEKAGVTIKNGDKLFPKGHLVASKDEIPKIREDLKLIFEQMGKPVDKRDFKDLKFFA